MTGASRALARTPVAVLGSVALLFSLLIPSFSLASSHREAPLISRDPTADNTDLYAFRSPDGSNTVTLIANYIPLEEPAGGPNFYAFDDNVLYELKVDNTGDAIADVTYQFRFQTKTHDSDLFGPSFLFNDFPINSVTDPDLLVQQTYKVTRVTAAGSTLLGSGHVPPTNIGPRSTPDASYEATIGSGGRTNLSNGGKAFAGPRDDPFFVDLGSIFDLGGLRPFNPAHVIPLAQSPGIDGVGGYNVHSIAVKVPITELTGTSAIPAFGSQDAVIGVWATASRQKVTVLKTDGTSKLNDGWVQVSRLGNPLINEVVIPLAKKDYWNFQQPTDDAQFAQYYTSPALAKIINTLYGTAIVAAGGHAARETGRVDLAAILLTGLKLPDGTPFTFTGTRQADMLRLNVAVAPCTAACSRFGVLGGDLAGFPNGRRLSDDVTDIELRAIADGYGSFVNGLYPTITRNYSPNNLIGDGVNENDKAFMAVFPFVAPPWSGYAMGVTSFHHPVGTINTGALPS
ncbi:MAG: DUF4331 domain-containing protein [Chloroflexota bacterium]